MQISKAFVMRTRDRAPQIRKTEAYSGSEDLITDFRLVGVHFLLTSIVFSIFFKATLSASSLLSLRTLFILTIGKSIANAFIYLQINSPENSKQHSSTLTNYLATACSLSCRFTYAFLNSCAAWFVNSFKLIYAIVRTSLQSTAEDSTVKRNAELLAKQTQIDFVSPTRVTTVFAAIFLFCLFFFPKYITEKAPELISKVLTMYLESFSFKTHIAIATSLELLYFYWKYLDRKNYSYNYVVNNLVMIKNITNDNEEVDDNEVDDNKDVYELKPYKFPNIITFSTKDVFRTLKECAQYTKNCGKTRQKNNKEVWRRVIAA